MQKLLKVDSNVKDYHGHMSPEQIEPEDIWAPAELKLTVRGIICPTSTASDEESAEAFDHFRRALWMNGLQGFNGRGVESFGKRMTFNSIWRPQELTDKPIDYFLTNLKKVLDSPEVVKYTWVGKFSITYETEMVPQFFLVKVEDTQVTYQEATLQYGSKQTIS